MQREKLQRPKKGREREEILGREGGVTPQHRGTGQLRRKVNFFSKSGGKKEIWKHKCRNRHSKDIVLAGSNR